MRYKTSLNLSNTKKIRLPNYLLHNILFHQFYNLILLKIIIFLFYITIIILLKIIFSHYY